MSDPELRLKRRQAWDEEVRRVALEREKEGDALERQLREIERQRQELLGARVKQRQRSKTAEGQEVENLRRESEVLDDRHLRRSSICKSREERSATTE